MTAFSEFDPREPLSEGRTVIEASAGTGKTFAISALVTRLIAEEGLPLEEILVVTFTRAATAELRARVRDRILLTLRALEAAGAARFLALDRAEPGRSPRNGGITAGSEAGGPAISSPFGRGGERSGAGVPGSFPLPG